MLHIPLAIVLLQSGLAHVSQGVDPTGVVDAEQQDQSLTPIRLTVVSGDDEQELSAALVERLSEHGVEASLVREPATTSVAKDTVVADVLVTTSAGSMRLVMSDAKVPRAYVREVPHDGELSAVAIEEASLIIAQSVLAMAEGRPVPDATPQEMPTEPPASRAEPPASRAEPSLAESSPRPKKNFPYGGYFGTFLGLSRVTEWAGPWLGYTLGFEGGYVFGKFPRHPALRIGLGVSLESLSLHELEFYSGLVQPHAKLRIGFARGPAWMYAMAAGGPSVFVSAFTPGPPEITTTLGGQVGLGVSFRLGRRAALGLEGVAAGTLLGTTIFGGQLHITGYFGRHLRRRSR